jgi:hypothetical protein
MNAVRSLDVLWNLITHRDQLCSQPSADVVPLRARLRICSPQIPSADLSLKPLQFAACR